MLKLPQKLGRGIAFWRPVDENTFLGSAGWTQVARFEGIDMRLRQAHEIYRGDTPMPLAADISEANYEITINGMLFYLPDPGLVNQYPPGLWNIFDLFSVVYAYQYGEYNLSGTYMTRAYHFGPKAINQQPLGQLLIRGYGGSSKRLYEVQFYLVRAGDIEMPMSGTEFQKMSIAFVPLVNPAYTAEGEEPQGLWFTYRDVIDNVEDLGIGM